MNVNQIEVEVSGKNSSSGEITQKTEGRATKEPSRSISGTNVYNVVDDACHDLALVPVSTGREGGATGSSQTAPEGDKNRTEDETIAEETEEGENPLKEIFSLRRPRDVFAGTSSGLKSVAKGMAIGIAALFASPIYLAKEKGLGGFFLGLGTGILTLVLSTISGVAIGSIQVVRGTLNTPVAMYSKIKGRVWDKDKRKWQEDFYSLKEEAEILKEPLDEKKNKKASNKKGSSKGKNGSAVADMTFYDALEISADASASEIRKAYYKQSLMYHPDKNDSAEAKEKFALVSDGYQVLSDPERRNIYDRDGKQAATEQMPEMDPAIFFSSLFGSFHFEPYVGKLQLASVFENDSLFDTSDDQANWSQKKASGMSNKKKQLHREVQLAVILAERLDNGILQGEEQFLASVTSEAHKLRDTPHGGDMLSAIGYTYINQARQWTSNFSLGYKMKERARNIKLKGNAASSIGKSFMSFHKIAKKQEAKENKKKKDDAKIKKLKENEEKEKEKKENNAKKKAKIIQEMSPEEQEEDNRRKAEEEHVKKVKVGCLVRIYGLESAAGSELNEAMGYVRNIDESKRRAIVLINMGLAPEEKSIKMTNLEILSDAPAHDEEMGNDILASFPILMDTMWNISLIDVQSTLMKVCYRVLKDMSVDADTRKERAKLLLLFGETFAQAAKGAKNAMKTATPEDKRRQMEFALQMMQAGANEEDIEHARRQAEEAVLNNHS